jgi:hypothetical protein
MDDDEFDKFLEEKFQRFGLRISFGEDCSSLSIIDEFDLEAFKRIHQGGLESLEPRLLREIRCLKFHDACKIVDYRELISQLRGLETFAAEKLPATTDLSILNRFSITGTNLCGAQIAGTDFFGLCSDKLETIHLDESNATDEDLELIVKRFPKLKILDIEDTKVTIEGVKKLVGLKELYMVNWFPHREEGLREYAEKHGLDAAKKIYNEWNLVMFSLPKKFEYRDSNPKWQHYLKHGEFPFPYQWDDLEPKK